MQGRKLNVKLLDAAELPRYAHDGDAGSDLCITEDCRLEPNARAIVGLGCAFEIPSGCVGLLSRVCQMVVVPFVPCDLVKVEKLSGTERGEDGFGSTGIE